MKLVRYKFQKLAAKFLKIETIFKFKVSGKIPASLGIKKKLNFFLWADLASWVWERVKTQKNTWKYVVSGC